MSPSRFARLAEYIDRATLVVPRDPPIPPADDVSHPHRDCLSGGRHGARTFSACARRGGWDVHSREGEMT